jgi:hypothetical protein
LTRATDQTGDGHRSDWWRPSDPKSWVLTMCPTKLYGSICMSYRGSQEMIYQKKFKSLHGVKRSGKTKIWIPLERRTWMESKELEGGSEEGPWEILLLPILRLSLSWIFKSLWVLREVEEGREDGLHGLDGLKLVNNGGERRKRGKRVDSFHCWPTGWSRAPPVRPVTALGRASEPLAVFPTRAR